MTRLQNSSSVTDFTRATAKYIERLKQTGDPEVLAVDGHAELVVQSADAYRMLMEAVELTETLAGIQRGLDQADRGELRPAEDFFREVAARHGTEK